MCLLYWYKSTKTDAEGAAIDPPRSRRVKRSAFGLPVVTAADKRKLPGVNLGEWDAPNARDLLTRPRTYGTEVKQLHSTLKHDAWKLSNSQVSVSCVCI